MRTRTTDKKFNGLCWITRHIKDDPTQPTFTTYFAKIPNGKSHKLTKIGSDSDQVSLSVMRERAKDLIEKTLNRGSATQTLNQFFDEIFIPDRENQECDTIQMKNNWDRDIRNSLGSSKMIDLETVDIYKLFMKVSKRSKSVGNKVLQLIKASYNLAIEVGILKYNPGHSIKKNSETDRVMFFTPEQKDRFMKALFSFGSEYKYSTAMIYVLYLSGARVGELARAKWTDLHGNKILLEDHKTAKKTGKPRVIYLSNEAMKIINNMPRSNETIFKIKDPNTCWKQIRVMADLKEFHLHDLRHNFCSQAVNNGIDMIRVGQLAGHKSVKTMEKYQHIFDQTSENDIKQIGNLLS